jgi:hypothetical protein
VTAGVGLTPTTFSGVVAGVATVEAAVVGIVGVRLRDPILVWLSAGLAAAAYGFTADWLEWEATTLISITSIVGGLLAVVSATAFLRGISSERLRLWLYPAGASAHAAAVTVVANAWIQLSLEDASGVTSAVAAAEAAIVGLIATVRRYPLLVLPAAASGAASYGLMAAWLDWTAPTVITVTAAVGATLLVLWEFGYLRGIAAERLRMWVPAAGAVGATAAVAVVVVAGSELANRPANGVFAGVVWFVAGLVGVIASRRRDSVIAGVATTLAAAGYGFGVAWLSWDAETFIAVTGSIGAVLLIATTFAHLAGFGSRRARIWLPSATAAGHLALLAASAAAVATPDRTDPAGVMAGVAAFEAVVLGIIGTARRNHLMIFAASTLAAVAYWLATVAVDLDGPGLVILTGATAMTVAVGASILTALAKPGSRWSMWTTPAHGLAGLGGMMSFLMAGAELSDEASLGAMALVSFGTGTYLAANTRFASDEWALGSFAAVAYVISAGLFMAWSAEANSAQGAVVFGTAALGLAATASWSARNLDTRWRVPLAIGGAGFQAVALIGASAEYGTNSAEFASALLIAGAALATHGLLAGRLRAVEAALVIWLIAGLVLIDEQLTLTLHAAVALTSAALLAVLEIERHRRHDEHPATPAALARAEWVLMIAPMAMAAYSMGDHLSYGIVLFLEGLLLTAWGAMTRIRRRAFIGFGGAVLAILLSAAIPMAAGARAGLTQGTWLLIGAIAAAVFIAVGSTIERQRAAIGRRLHDLSEILEDWE